MSNELKEAAGRLADLLTRENDALKRLDLSAAVALVPAKEAALADLTKQPDTRMLPAMVGLAALGQRLGELASENQALLERAIAVQTRIVRIIARADATPPASARYGIPGARTLSHRPAAIALSTRA